MGIAAGGSEGQGPGSDWVERVLPSGRVRPQKPPVDSSHALSSFERPSRHGSVVCLSECCYGDQPGEGVWNTVCQPASPLLCRKCCS